MGMLVLKKGVYVGVDLTIKIAGNHARLNPVCRVKIDMFGSISNFWPPMTTFSHVSMKSYPGI